MFFRDVVSFRPASVTILAVITYVSIFASLLWIHLVPPPVAPRAELESWGVDLDAAWQDLREITREFHPYNSRRNDDVRAYLLARIKEIIKQNVGAGYDGTVEVIDDNETNVIYAGENRNGLTVYFEGTNIIVYIRGTDPTLSPVLVNAHYDSVSTGYGATDDGMATVSVLQVIQAFTRPSLVGLKQIKRGIIALLNNGEEDYLNGAVAWSVHPMANLSHSFLNLEGAGAGGRATLFRSTDAEVTKWYKHSKRPFGSVVSGDGFKQGLVKSQTDYKIFTENLGMRGLDVAFWEPRSRYHTQDDDVKHSSKESLWHMLGTALETLHAATEDTSRQFDRGKQPLAGTGHTAVWFDLFGRSFAVLRLHTLFALTITLLVVPFVMMVATLYLLYSQNKLYYFSNTPLIPTPPEYLGLPATTRGWRGFFRFPVAFVFATSATIGLAFLVNKVNPMIAYSSQYSVWAMFLTLWWSFAWFVLRGADADTVRPTALGRGYAFIEQWLLWWAVLIAVAASIGQQQLASGYWVLISYSGVFLSAWISLLELFALPPKPSEGSEYNNDNTSRHTLEDDQDATEETPLIRGTGRPGTFGGYNRGIHAEDVADETEDEDVPHPRVYGREQAWSKDLPTWVWIPQFLLSVPVPLIFTASIALLLSTAVNQTGADGTSTLSFYLLLSFLSIFLLLPAAPFFHRITYHVTATLFLVCVATTIYNLTAFPFSNTNRLKVYFQQSVNLDNPSSAPAYLVGHPDFVRSIVEDHIPSAHNQELVVADDPLRVGLTRVQWDAPAPNAVPGVEPQEWISLTTTKLGRGHARITLSGKNTRACKLLFDAPVFAVNVTDRESVVSRRAVAEGGAREVRLWGREWGAGWEVEMKTGRKTGVKEKGEGEEEEERVEEEIRGRAVCLWSDANDARREVPALWEVERFLPDWAVASKLADGILEGWRAFEV